MWAMRQAASVLAREKCSCSCKCSVEVRLGWVGLGWLEVYAVVIMVWYGVSGR